MNALPQLRPMSFTDLIDASFRLYRSNFVTFVGIVAAVQVPIAILQIILQNTLGANYMRALLRLSSGGSAALLAPELLTTVLLYFVALILLAFLQVLFLQTLGTGALARAISGSYLGQRIGITEAYRFGTSRFLNLLGAALLVGVCNLIALVVAVGVPLGLLFVASQSSGSSGAGAAIGAIVLMVVLFLVYFIGTLVVASRLLFTTQAIVLEDHSAINGLRRSWQLSQGSFWRILGILTLITVLVGVLAGIPAGVISFVLNMLAGSNLDRMLLAQTVNLVLTYAGNILAMPLQFAIFTLLYYDLRVRKEAFDLELRSQQIQPAPETQAL
ncbi:MAG TPA: glycerophosphoryl diester phosphodiesterase membrane domain-containing protein [Roseiflexaceae bacterium]|nr:glycerophosphoryl diester phosphodiesterase membrane domain-containing protein [Roseiflexaceae bacterium]